LQNVIVVGLELGVLEGQVVDLRVFVLVFGFKGHAFSKELVLSSLSHQELIFEGLNFQFKIIVGGIVRDLVGFILLFANLKVIL
jgi:hypothetical protein